MAILFKDISWHTLFLIGGLTPLVLLPFMAIILKDKPKKVAVEQAIDEAVPGMVEVLFKNQQYKYTMPLWVGFFFTLMINYILISWLPNLLMEQGLEKPQAFMVMLVFQVGAVIGTLALGYLLDRLKLWQMAVIIYSGLFIALVLLFTSSLYSSTCFWQALWAGFSRQADNRFCMAFHRFSIRGTGKVTGVGSAISFGADQVP